MSRLTTILTAFPGVHSRNTYADFASKGHKKSEPQQFASWLEKHKGLIGREIKPCKEDPTRWAKIEWVSKLIINDPVTHQKKIINKRDFRVVCVDPKSKHAGNIYNNYGKFPIYGILCQTALLWRPVHLVAITIYHLAAGWFVAIIQGKLAHETAKEIALRVVREFVDVIRTPLYCTILLVVQITAVLVTPFKPILIYDFRALIDELSNELYWGKRYGTPGFIDLVPCQRRITNIMDFEINRQTPRYLKKIEYQDLSKPLFVGLDNMFARHL